MKKQNVGYHHTVAALFEEQANKTPHYIAVSDTHTKFTYQALNEKANQLAGWLKKQGVKSGEFVGILLDPCVDYIVSVLAIIKMGGVYLPLDALAPQRRLADILNDAAPCLVITNEKFSHHLIEHPHQMRLIRNMHLESAAYPRENIVSHINFESPLYMMYTSGSTGKPKGVIVPHQAIANLAIIENTTGIKETEHVAQFSNLAFDGSSFEIWIALLNGARLVIVPPEARQDHINLKNFIENNYIKYMFLPTGYFHQLIKSATDTLNEVSTIVFGGEQVNTSLLKSFVAYRKNHKLPILLINGYGPTEATAYTCYQAIHEQDVMNDEQWSCIGKQIKNTKTYILDEQKNIVTEGELYVSGINLAIGYHNCQIENKEKFIANPFCNEAPFQRLYKTGDKVRLLESGDLQFLGRLDDQVKIGGFRIHLNEIENHLMKHPLISLAAVVVELGGGSHQLLAAYMVISSMDNNIDADEIRSFLSTSLPQYMLPAKYILVDTLPLNLVGKVDKSKLAAVTHTDLSCHIDAITENHIEDKIKSVWQHLLGRTSIDVNKNLFELGANSLLITEACTRINEALESELQVSNIISYPTIHKLSRYLDGDIETITVKKKKRSDSDDIAIIGMSCRFPKAESLQDYWDNLCQGKSCLTRFNEKELSMTHNDRKLWDKNFVPVKGVLSGIELFDANFFGFNPVDASITDPQHRLFLECAWEALEHASIAPAKLDSTIISVFAGMSDSTYGQENLSKNSWFCNEHDRFQQRIAVSTSMLSTQVSYRLNLRGRSLNVNTACSTGLVTVAQACEDLKAGQSDVALAGAVSIAIPQVDGYFYQSGSIESPDGECRPFSCDANGTVFSNGVGVVILKRYEDAIRDNDTIYAVIKGSGVNNDGSDKLGFMAPSTSGQIACVRDALTDARVGVDEIGFIEAHGTATALGDVVEMDALKAVYGAGTEKKQFCALGSVKGNIGHTDVVAGIAGLIKTVLCLYHQKIPSTLHFLKPNPALLLNDSPFFINNQLMEWATADKKRYAGVSSFGVGGTNAHMILSEHIEDKLEIQAFHEQLIILSAKTEKALEHNTDRLIDYLTNPMKSLCVSALPDVAYTLQTGREDFQWRRIGVGKTVSEIAASLVQSKMRLCNDNRHHYIIFMFPGQGMQYHEMAAQLMDAVPFFSNLVEEGVQIAQPFIHCNLLEIIRNPLDDRLNQTQYAQPALFIIEYTLARYLMECGVKPHAFIGHSIGEYVAACLAGVFSFADAIALVCERGLLMANAPTGDMLAIDCTVNEFEMYQHHADVDLALHNAPNHCVASGNSAEIVTLEKYLLNQNKSYQKLKVSHAFHSRSMDVVAQPFKELFSNVSLSAPHIPIISNVTGDWLSAHDATDPNYWYSHLRHTVQLCQGFEKLITNDHAIFIEVGPGRSLSTFLKDVSCLHKCSQPIFHTLPTHHRQQTDLHQFFSTVGCLWQEGVNINWACIHNHERRHHVPLPTYAFQKQRYWIEPDQNSLLSNGEPRIYKPVWSHKPAYLQAIPLSVDAIIKRSWIIFKDDEGLAESVISLLKHHNIDPIVIEQSSTYSEISATHFMINPSEKTHYSAVFKSIKKILHDPVILHWYSCTDTGVGLLSLDKVDTQLMLGFYSVLYLTQSYIEQIGDQVPLRCGLITVGTQHVTGTERMSPVNASLLGSCRVIREEHPLLCFKLIDVNLNEPVIHQDNRASVIVSSCVTEGWDVNDSVVVYRDGYQWDLSYTETKPQHTINRFKDQGVYLFTGGLGGVALSLCEAIVKTVSKPHFILLSRSHILKESEWDAVLLNPMHKLYKKISQLKKLQELGATLFIHQADVTQVESLLSIINHYKVHIGTIDGVIHGAGVPGGGLAQLKSKEMSDAVFMPKIHGAYCLAAALQGFMLDFVVLLSSTVVLNGEAGQIDYTGANACLDAFAVSQLFPAQFVVSLNWNTWRDIGMTVETSRPKGVTYLGRGNDISPQQGQQLFLQAMQNSYANMVISNYDIGLCSGIVLQSSTELSVSGVKMARETSDATCIYIEPKNAMQETLAKLWQDTLGIESVGINDDFFALGGHSLKALRLIEKINKQFDSNLTINHLYKASTIKQLSEVITAGSRDRRDDIAVPLNVVEGKSPYIFLCHPASGMIYCFNALISQCDLSFSIYGLQDPGVSAGRMLYDNIFSMADAYLAAIKTIQPNGPYYLIGYSFGGTVVYEIANMLKLKKEKIALLTLIEGWSIFSPHQQSEVYFKESFHAVHHDLSANMVDLAWARIKLLLNHVPTRMNHDMVLFKASQLFDDYKLIDDPFNGWSQFNDGKIICHTLDANHETIINVENSRRMIDFLQQNGFFDIHH